MGWVPAAWVDGKNFALGVRDCFDGDVAEGHLDLEAAGVAGAVGVVDGEEFALFTVGEFAEEGGVFGFFVGGRRWDGFVSFGGGG